MLILAAAMFIAVVMTVIVAALRGTQSIISFLVQFGIAASLIFIAIMIFITMIANAIT